MVGPHFQARVLFDQRQQVGRVAIDLVRAGKYEGCVRTVPAGGLEQVERAVGVDAEIRSTSLVFR